MRLLLAEFRRFAIPEPLEKQSIDLATLIKSACQRAVADLGCVVEKTLSSPQMPVIGDRRALSTVLTEVLENAAGVMQENHCLPQLIQVSGAIENGTCTVRIADTGIGVLAENKPHIFEPLFTTRPRGHGLGLAIAAEIMREHEGGIAEEGTPGKGARFRIWLPAIPGSEEE
jgi:signal transduction histidine kinase